MGKFILWQIKRWLVPALVILGVMTMSMVILGASESLTYTLYNDPYGGTFSYNDGSSTFFMGAMLYSSLVSIVFPMFVFNYKFGIRRADFYKQLPFAENQLRRTILLSGLVIALVGVSLAFLTGTGILLIRHFAFDKSTLISTPDYTQYLYTFKYRYLLVFYLLLMLNVFATYSISCLFVYHNVTVFEAIIGVLLAQLCLGLLPYAIASQVSTIKGWVTNDFVEPTYVTFSTISPVIGAVNINSLFYGMEEEIWKNLYWNIGVYLISGLGSFIWMFMVKDRSADIENEKGNPSIITLIALHGGFLGVMLFANSLASYTIYLGLIINIFVIASYFFINVLFGHGFKLRMQQWIPLLVISLIVIADLVILAVTRSANVENYPYY